MDGGGFDPEERGLDAKAAAVVCSQLPRRGPQKVLPTPETRNLKLERSKTRNHKPLAPLSAFSILWVKTVVCFNRIEQGHALDKPPNLQSTSVRALGALKILRAISLHCSTGNSLWEKVWNAI